MPTVISRNHTATPAETAAIAAAVERFRLETSVAPAPEESGPDPWLRAALVEGVSAKDGFGPGDPGQLS
jgi:hypothetical protein